MANFFKKQEMANGAYRVEMTLRWGWLVLMAEGLADFLTVASEEQNNWDADQDISSFSKRNSTTTRILMKETISTKNNFKLALHLRHSQLSSPKDGCEVVIRVVLRVSRLFCSHHDCGCFYRYYPLQYTR